MSETVYAVFGEPGRAESAAGALLDHGVQPSEISLVVSEEYGRRRGTVDDPELSYTVPTIVAGPIGRTDRFDPLGNDLRNSGEIGVMAGEAGPRSEVKPPSQNGADQKDFDPLELNEAYTPEAKRRLETDQADSIEPPLKGDPSEVGLPSYDFEQAAKRGITITTAHDAAIGAAKGVGIGLGIGSLAAIAAITVPGFGLIVGGGALAIALAGIAATAGAGAVAGGVYGFLRDQGMPADEIPAFQSAYEKGGAILTVQLTGRIPRDEIEGILRKYEAGLVVRYGYVA